MIDEKQDTLQSVLHGLNELGIDLPVGTSLDELKAAHRPVELSKGELQDDLITLKIRGGSKDGETIEISALVVKLTSEPLEQQHGMESVDGEVTATAGFVVALDRALQEMGYNTTPAIATEFWL